MATLKTLEHPLNHVRLGCVGPGSCNKYHDIHVPCDDPTRLLRELEMWEYKHSRPTCRKTFPVFMKREIPRDFDDSAYEAIGKAPWWLDPDLHGLRENTNFTGNYVNSVPMAVTSWATLASDTNLLAGASSATVDNGTTGAPLEVAITARIKNGTTPTTGKEIDIYAWAGLDDGVTYPDAITGVDTTITITGTDAQNNALALATSFASTTTTGGTYPTGWHTMRPVALGSLFGSLPRWWGLWIVHNSVAAFVAGSVANYKGLYIGA